MDFEALADALAAYDRNVMSDAQLQIMIKATRVALMISTHFDGKNSIASNFYSERLRILNGYVEARKQS